jgi:hypothetical protein
MFVHSSAAYTQQISNIFAVTVQTVNLRSVLFMQQLASEIRGALKTGRLVDRVPEHGSFT